MKSKSPFTFLLFLLGALPAAQAGTIYFAQVADGGGYTTAFTLCNPSSTDITGTLKLYTSNGSPRILRIGAVDNWQFSLSIPARGSRRLVTNGAANEVTNGWASFESAGSVQGVATFEMRNGAAALCTLAGVIGAAPVSKFAVPIDVTSLANTGFAIANPSGILPVTVQLSLLDQDGKTVSQTTMAKMNPLGAGYQIADFVTTAFPSVVTGFSGTLVAEVVGSGSMAATGLTVKEAMLSAIPVFESTGAPTVGCNYSITPVSRSHGAGSETGTIAVTTGAGCTWIASSNAAWLAISSGATGTGSGSVSYSVAANAAANQRTASITVSGQSYTGTFTATQAGQSSSTPTNRERAQMLLGQWTFSYTVTSNFNSRYAMTSVYQDESDPAQWYAIGTDEYGDPVLAGWFDDINLYLFLDEGTVTDKVYTFEFAGTNSVAGCYYQPDHGSSSIGRCYTMTGLRSGYAEPLSFIGPQERLAIESQLLLEGGSFRGYVHDGVLSRQMESMRRLGKK